MTEDPSIHLESVDEHLDEMTCLLYLEGQLERKRGQHVSAHTQDCLTCRTLAACPRARIPSAHPRHARRR